MGKTALANRDCAELPARAKALLPKQANALLAQVPGWTIAAGELTRSFKFKDYHESMAFVNATAWISHGQNHHPDIELGYNKVKMRYSTHSVGGLSENDFICAARVVSGQWSGVGVGKIILNLF
jgi:4a-hydroxytetrahydrobiopterin dehydratase